MRKGKNANYDFERKKDPSKPMGQGSFANMPSGPMFLDYVDEADYRDGIVNGFSANIRKVSDIHENQR